MIWHVILVAMTTILTGNYEFLSDQNVCICKLGWHSINTLARVLNCISLKGQVISIVIRCVGYIGATSRNVPLYNQYMQETLQVADIVMLLSINSHCKNIVTLLCIYFITVALFYFINCKCFTGKSAYMYICITGIPG